MGSRHARKHYSGAHECDIVRCCVIAGRLTGLRDPFGSQCADARESSLDHLIEAQGRVEWAAASKWSTPRPWRTRKRTYRSGRLPVCARDRHRADTFAKAMSRRPDVIG